ncbi:hypothetical protein P3T23_007989 [Paraburkholderia sp. GAS448]
MTVRAPARASDAQAFIALSAATFVSESVPSACNELWVCRNAGLRNIRPATRLSYWLSGNGEAAMRGGR